MGVAELLDEVVDQTLVPVVAAEVVVTGRRLDLEDAAPISRMDTSNVPPPRSKTRIALLVALVEAVGQCGRSGLVDDAQDLRPAISPASLVAWRWASSKYAGTVTTASTTGSPR